MSEKCDLRKLRRVDGRNEVVNGVKEKPAALPGEMKVSNRLKTRRQKTKPLMN